jgi:hypothetical protein
VKNSFSRDERAQATEAPERPLRVNLALGMLCLSLAISVARVFVTWLGLGAFFPPEYFLTAILILQVASSFIPGSRWMHLGGVLFVPVAVWLYYLIANGKNWARITLLVYVLLETAASILSLFIVRYAYFDPTPPAISDWSFPREEFYESKYLMLFMIPE